MLQIGQKVTHPEFSLPLTVTNIDASVAIDGYLIEAVDSDGLFYLDYEDTFEPVVEDTTTA